MSAIGGFVRSALLAVGIGAAVLAAASGCGDSPPTSAPSASSAPASSASAPATATPARPAVSGAVLTSVARCMRSHGVAVSAKTSVRVTARQLKDAFRALPIARQRSVFAACGSLLPADIRKVVRQRMAEETAGPAATSSP